MEHVNGWCFRGIYKGGLWEDDLHVSALLSWCKNESRSAVNKMFCLKDYDAYGFDLDHTLAKFNLVNLTKVIHDFVTQISFFFFFFFFQNDRYNVEALSTGQGKGCRGVVWVHLFPCSPEINRFVLLFSKIKILISYMYSEYVPCSPKLPLFPGFPHFRPLFAWNIIDP